VRGYNINNFDPNECTPSAESTCPELSRLIGSRIAKASVEFRVPLLGPDRISLIPFQYLPTEVSLFADGGVAWTGNDLPTLEFSTDSAERVPVFSTGIAARFNVLGALILETYWAYPFQRKNPSGQWGLRFTPGW
jgi:outer membrane protein assembly factor BamA